jgi:hypothetical protein
VVDCAFSWEGTSPFPSQWKIPAPDYLITAIRPRSLTLVITTSASEGVGHLVFKRQDNHCVGSPSIIGQNSLAIKEEMGREC